MNIVVYWIFYFFELFDNRMRNSELDFYASFLFFWLITRAVYVGERVAKVGDGGKSGGIACFFVICGSQNNKAYVLPKWSTQI